MTQSGPCSRGGKSPGDSGVGFIAASHQGCQFAGEGSPIGYPPIETLATEHAQLDFCHVKPTAMFGGVVKLQALQDPPCLRRVKGFVQRRRPVGIQVVQHHTNLLRLGVGLVRQPPHLVGEVPHPTSLGDRHMAPTPQWLAEHEQITGAVAPVLIVEPLSPSRPGWERYATLPNELSGGLIKTDRRSLGVVGLLIQVQDILHGRYKLCAHRWNAPLLPLPGLQLVFLSIWRTVSGEMDGAKPNSTTFPAKRRSVQRPRPSGGVLHATAITWASCFPLSFRRCPGLGCSRNSGHAPVPLQQGACESCPP